MRKPLLVILVATVTGMATGFSGAAYAAQYPVAPANTLVTLEPGDFIRWVPYASWTGGPDAANPVIGDNLNQHPGAFQVGWPQSGAFFIGLFGHPLDTSNPDAALYLWETTSSGLAGVDGPQIQLGFWDGMTFFAAGNPQTASYWDTGVSVDIGYGQRYELNSSRTPLTDFGLPPEFPAWLNAIEVEAWDGGHNQVIAAAVAVPEPTATSLLGTSLVCFLGYAWRRPHRRILS